MQRSGALICCYLNLLLDIEEGLVVAGSGAANPCSSSAGLPMAGRRASLSSLFDNKPIGRCEICLAMMDPPMMGLEGLMSSSGCSEGQASYLEWLDKTKQCPTCRLATVETVETKCPPSPPFESACTPHPPDEGQRPRCAECVRTEPVHCPSYCKRKCTRPPAENARAS